MTLWRLCLCLFLASLPGSILGVVLVELGVRGIGALAPLGLALLSQLVCGACLTRETPDAL